MLQILLLLIDISYADQFGVPNGGKIKMRSFRDLFVKISPLPKDDQVIELKNNMKKWMGEEEQIDDILVMGIRFS